MYFCMDLFSFIPIKPLSILDLSSLATILFFTYNEFCYLVVTQVITLFVFVTIYFTYSTKTP